MRILIAEDNRVDLALLKGLLTREGHEVTTAAHGLETWAILQSDNAPKLAILDWHMPGMDGLSVCRALRELENKPYIFVILLTSSDQPAQLLEGLRAGADDYLTKPVVPALLRARLEVAQRILRLQAKFMANEEKLLFQADHDFLTSLFNRAGILGHLTREIGRARRHQLPLGVLLADLDFFKQVNDTHGHAAGDLALCEVARRLTCGVRLYDTVGRLGGEEFLILLPGCDAAGVRAQGERLRECIAESPFELAELRLSMTASIGGAALDLSNTEDGSALIARADLALYEAKHSGRNQVRVSSPVTL